MEMATDPNEIKIDEEDCTIADGLMPNPKSVNSSLERTSDMAADSNEIQIDEEDCTVAAGVMPNPESVNSSLKSTLDMATDPNEIQIDEEDCTVAAGVMPNPESVNSSLERTSDMAADPNEIQIDEEDANEIKPSFNIYDVRKAKSIASIASSDAGDLSSWSESEDEIDPANISDEDSEVEFEKYLKVTANRRQHTYLSEHHPISLFKKTKICSKFRIQDEFESLPPLEKLSIHCTENTHLAKLGVVENVVGCVLAVKSTSNCSPLDLDTVLFDKDRNAVGPIADVIGTFGEPTYCIRFNSNTEASVFPSGTEIFYAPKSEEYTKRILGNEMKTPWRKANPRVESEDEPVFSDDEQEREYQEQKRRTINVRNNTRGRGNRNQRRVHFGENTRGGSHNTHSARVSAERNWDWHRKRPHNYNSTVTESSVAAIDCNEKPMSSLTENRSKQVPHIGSHGTTPTESCSSANDFTEKPASTEHATKQVPDRDSHVAESSLPVETKNDHVAVDDPYAEFGCYGSFSLVQYPNN